MLDNYRLSGSELSASAPSISTVRKRYEELSYWRPLDKWHIITNEKIASFISREIQKNSISTGSIFNLGSGGNSYGLSGESHIHIDLVRQRLKGIELPLVATIDQLPLRSEVADLVICVGGVINYANPAFALPEIARIMKSGAYLLLEFESSRSFEYSKEIFGKPSRLVLSFYNGHSEPLQVYSEEFIISYLNQAGLSVIRKETFHILSSLVYRFFRNENRAAKWAWFDGLARILPTIGPCGSNVILAARKASRCSLGKLGFHGGV